MSQHTAAAQTVPTSIPTDAEPGRAFRLRRIIGAGCLPATFLVMIAGTALLDPLNDSANEPDTLAQAVGHAGQIAALGWAEILTAVLTLAGLLTLVGRVRGRGGAWANATAVLAVVAAVGMIAVAFNHFVVSGLTESALTTSQRVEAFTRFHQAGGPIIAFILMGELGFVLAGVTAWRSRLSSPLVLIPTAALLIISPAPGQAAEYASYVAGLVMATWIARDLLRARA